MMSHNNIKCKCGEICPCHTPNVNEIDGKTFAICIIIMLTVALFVLAIESKQMNNSPEHIEVNGQDCGHWKIHEK